MDKKRIETKVGLFVFLGLALLAVLLLQFSKGTSFFRGTYMLRLHATNIGGLKPRSYVLMSGVQVGVVKDITLATDGKSVTIFLKVYNSFIVHRDARFLIEQSGFLGDQYVAIVPTKNEPGTELHDGDEVDCEEPFNLQEVARSAGGFIKRVDEAAAKLNEAIADVRKYALNEQTLTNLSVAIGNLRGASERAVVTVNGINDLFVTNGPTVTYALSNISGFSDDLGVFAKNLNSLLTTNSESVARSVQNIETSTVALKTILEDVRAGKGAAGKLLHDETVATNLAIIVENLSVTTSNLNRLGIWGILWSRKPAKTDKSSSSQTSPSSKNSTR
ncbi:MAG: phospholipid/cholesterol/gamma-HCH transport system substrate-binding protein [Verrucomicrobiota bacterium]|jgi:ABC-type transporter Mla subunit MlaD